MDSLSQITDLGSKHFHIFCSTIIYSDVGKRLGNSAHSAVVIDSK